MAAVYLSLNSLQLFVLQRSQCKFIENVTCPISRYVPSHAVTLAQGTVTSVVLR